MTEQSAIDAANLVRVSSIKKLLADAQFNDPSDTAKKDIILTQLALWERRLKDGLNALHPNLF